MSQEDASIAWSLPVSSEVIIPLFSPWTQDCKHEIKLVKKKITTAAFFL